jgi:hypothetical protein
MAVVVVARAWLGSRSKKDAIVVPPEAASVVIDHVKMTIP